MARPSIIDGQTLQGRVQVSTDKLVLDRSVLVRGSLGALTPGYTTKTVKIVSLENLFQFKSLLLVIATAQKSYCTGRG